MIRDLWTYFGVTGITSLLAWATALVLFAWCARSRQRTKWLWTGAAIALAGWLLAHLNSHFVSAIQVDRSEEQAAALERQKALRQQLETELKQKAANIRFVEDTPQDTLDMAGVSLAPTDVYAAAAMPDEPDKYSYRKGGKQQRAVSETALTNPPLPGTESAPAVQAKSARLLPETDVVRANRFDRVNLFAARFTLWLALVLVVLDYLNRFNRTVDHLVALPISNRWLDATWPKTHVVALQAGPDALRRYLDNIVRKNETFLYFGPRDPLPGLAVCRLRFWKWSFWPMPKLAGAGRPAEFVFESVWYHRYCAWTSQPGWLTDLLDKLQFRKRTRAAARRTVHLVWDFPFDERLLSLAEYCREANLKLVVVNARVPVAECEEVTA